MKYYMAPMEGITTAVYRKAYQSVFTSFDKYFTPFLVPHLHKDFTTKEKREILSSEGGKLAVVPQILTNQAEDFVRTAKLLAGYGFDEVNLNIGCPSKTVVSKNRGAGFLKDPEVLKHFFDYIFMNLDMKISIKTRTGMYAHEELEALMEVFRLFPMEELIVHPRTQRELYSGSANQQAYTYAYTHTNCPICYNGDICTPKDAKRIEEQYAQTQAVMIGRGLIRNPALLQQIKDEQHNMDTNISLKVFHDALYQGYCETYNCDEKNVLFKMKEVWCYECGLFAGSEKIAKKIKKASGLSEYREQVDRLFEEYL